MKDVLMSEAGRQAVRQGDGELEEDWRWTGEWSSERRKEGRKEE